MGSLHALPGVRLDAPAPPALNLAPAEVADASGGYVQPVRQLRALHDRGFSRAYISKATGRVVLERAHYDAVVRGQFGGVVPANDASQAVPPGPDREGLKKFFREKRKK